MLSIKPQSQPQSCVPNILPCKIQHTGPVNATTRHWNPLPSSSASASTQESYFRGRKLIGSTVSLPEGYKGVVVEKTKETLPRTIQDEGEDVVEDVKVLREVAGFKEVVVWGHEVRPQDSEDEYVRGIGEWISLARTMNSY